MADLRTTSFSLGRRGERFLFFDAFLTSVPSDRRLVLVSTYYPDVRFDFRSVEVELDGLRLERFEEIGLNEYEPTRSVLYPLGDVASRPRHELVVRSLGETVTASITPDPVTDRRRFSIATLFKDDWRDLDTFVRYYREQGVERFYLFYNGELSTVRSRLPAGDDLVYGEWDFPYWLEPSSEAFHARLVDPQARRNHHHAQPAFLTMVRRRFLAECSFLALIDLDELLFVPGETVRSYVERINAVSLSARNHWAEVRRRGRWAPPWLWKTRGFRAALTLGHRARGGEEAPKLDYSDLGRVWANPRSEGGRRVKTVYRHDYPGLFGIHGPKRREEIRYTEELKLYHLVDAHGRYSRVHADAAQLSLISAAGADRQER